MKKSTSTIISIATGLLPAWFVAYFLTEMVNDMTESVQYVGGKRMLYFIHPSLKLFIAALLTALFLFIWYKLTHSLWEKIQVFLSKLHFIDESGDKQSFSFFQFGKISSENVVKAIFYFGILAVLLKGANILNLIFFSQGLILYHDEPVASAVFSLIILLIFILCVVIWKFICEALLIILRAFEAYYIKTVKAEETLGAKENQSRN